MARGAPDGLMQSDFTRRMAFPKQTVDSAVAKMQGDGLVALESAEDLRKEKSVRLTDTEHVPRTTAWRVSVNHPSSSTTSTTNRSRSRCWGSQSTPRFSLEKTAFPSTTVSRKTEGVIKKVHMKK